MRRVMAYTHINTTYNTFPPFIPNSSPSTSTDTIDIDIEMADPDPDTDTNKSPPWIDVLAIVDTMWSQFRILVSAALFALLLYFYVLTILTDAGNSKRMFNQTEYENDVSRGVSGLELEEMMMGFAMPTAAAKVGGQGGVKKRDGGEGMLVTIFTTMAEATTSLTAPSTTISNTTTTQTASPSPEPTPTGSPETTLPSSFLTAIIFYSILGVGAVLLLCIISYIEVRRRHLQRVIDESARADGNRDWWSPEGSAGGIELQSRGGACVEAVKGSRDRRDSLELGVLNGDGEWVDVRL